MSMRNPQQEHDPQLPSPVLPDDVDADLTCTFEPRIVVVLGLMAALLCVTFFIMLYAHTCGKYIAGLLRRRSTITTVTTGSTNAAATRGSTTTGYLSLTGVSQRVIDALPSFHFADVGGLKQGMECAVCLSQYHENDVLRLLPRCKHAFHASCIDKWLISRSSCPLCRSLISFEDVVNLADLFTTTNHGSTIGGEVLQVVVDPPDGLGEKANPAGAWRIAPTADALMMQRRWSHFMRNEELKKSSDLGSSSHL